MWSFRMWWFGLWFTVDLHTHLCSLFLFLTNPSLYFFLLTLPPTLSLAFSLPVCMWVCMSVCARVCVCVCVCVGRCVNSVIIRTVLNLMWCNTHAAYAWRNQKWECHDSFTTLTSLPHVAMVTLFCHGYTMLPWLYCVELAIPCHHGYTMLPWPYHVATYFPCCYGYFKSPQLYVDMVTPLMPS